MTVAGKGSIASESTINDRKKGRLTAAFVRSVNRPGVSLMNGGQKERYRRCQLPRQDANQTSGPQSLYSGKSSASCSHGSRVSAKM